MFARYASAVATGTLVTLALLYAMQGLIDLQPGAKSEIRPGDFVNWIHLPREEATPPPPEPYFDKKPLSEAPVPPIGRAPTGTGECIYIPVRPDAPREVDKTHEGLSDPDYRIHTFPVKVENGGVFVLLPPPEELDALDMSERTSAVCEGSCMACS